MTRPSPRTTPPPPAPAPARRAVFLDRDGTINREVHYLVDPARLRLLPGAARAIRRLNRAGFAVVIVTNQSAVARGLLDESRLHEIHRLLLNRLERQGAKIDAVYYCPHHPTAGRGPYRRRCRCRKPAPGLVRRAERDLGLRLDGSWVVGDSERDVGLARRTPLNSIRLAPRGRRPAAGTAADHVAAHLTAAVELILTGRRPRRGR